MLYYIILYYIMLYIILYLYIHISSSLQRQAILPGLRGGRARYLAAEHHRPSGAHSAAL